MRTTDLLTVSAVLLAVSPAFGQNNGPAAVPVAPNVAKPAMAAATGSPHLAAKPAVTASTAESRSAAALALSHEPTFDEGTAERIKQAALSYSDIAVRGG